MEQQIKKEKENKGYRRHVRISREADPAASGKRSVWTAPSDGAVTPLIGSKTLSFYHHQSDHISIWSLALSTKPPQILDSDSEIQLKLFPYELIDPIPT